MADGGAAEPEAAGSGDAPLVEGAAGHLRHVDPVGHRQVIEVNHAAIEW